MDTPAVPAPRDARERAILEHLEPIRDQLLLLKQDRTKYIRSQDVLPLYEQTIDQVKELNNIRAEREDKEENRCRSARDKCRPDLADILCSGQSTRELFSTAISILSDGRTK